MTKDDAIKAIERDAVVKWLRQPIINSPVGGYKTRLLMAWDWIFRPSVAMRIGLLVAANAIERGEHLPPEKA